MNNRATDELLREIGATVELDGALQALGESVHPVILGEPEGYIAKAKEFLRSHICPGACETLSSKGFSSFIETAGAIADMLHVAVYGVNPQYSAAVVWNAAAALAKFGLPATLGCVPCPLAEKEQ
jgi:hypothetical protein